MPSLELYDKEQSPFLKREIRENEKERRRKEGEGR
jgi:hypothetical protein